MSIFGGGSAAKSAQTKTDLSANVTSNGDLSPEEFVTSQNFQSIEGKLVGAMTITPAIAEKWLERNVANVRNPMEPSIGEYAEAMKKGQWDFNGETIKFDKDGNLADGQNRLISCVQSGKSFISVVVYGIDSAMNIDGGRKRTDAQLLANEGFSDSPSVSALVNALHNFKAKSGTSFSQVGHGKSVLTRQDKLQFAKDNARELMHSISATKKTAALFNKPTVHSALHFLFAEKAGTALADEFYTSLIDGVALSATSPILHLKTKLSVERGNKNAKMASNAYAGLIVKTWNLWISNQEVQRLTYSYDRDGIGKIKRSPISR